MIIAVSLTTAFFCLAGFAIYSSFIATSSKTHLVDASLTTGNLELAAAANQGEIGEIYYDLFSFWKAHHNKEYDSVKEEAKRLKIFAENYKKIQEWN